MPQTSCMQTRGLRATPEGAQHSPEETKGAEKREKVKCIFFYSSILRTPTAKLRGYLVLDVGLVYNVCCISYRLWELQTV